MKFPYVKRTYDTICVNANILLFVSAVGQIYSASPTENHEWSNPEHK